MLTLITQHKPINYRVATNPDATSVKLLVVHGVDGGVSLGSRPVSLKGKRLERRKKARHTTKPKPLERPVSRSFMTMHYSP
jgi:hypothetical protein